MSGRTSVLPGAGEKATNTSGVAVVVVVVEGGTVVDCAVGSVPAERALASVTRSPTPPQATAVAASRRTSAPGAIQLRRDGARPDRRRIQFLLTAPGDDVGATPAGEY
jgi:hypothetical protein